MRDVTHLIYHHKLGGEIELMVLKIPEGARDWTRQMRSLEWFNARELDRAFGTTSRHKKAARGNTEWATSRSLCEIERKLFSLNYPETPLESLPTHSSVWDLYKALGYDYKKKKYTVLLPTQ